MPPSEHDQVAQLLGDAPDDRVEQAQLLTALRSSLFGRRAEPVRIGRYEIETRIGGGGGGAVYRAWDPGLDRAVAIKLLHPPTDGATEDPAWATRLQREAQALAQLSHPNVLPVYDVGTADDQVFIAMQYVAGEDLRRWLAAGPHHPRDVMRLFTAAGRGLAAAHAAGLVHRDFKPANVLLGDGQVYVTDFGLARLAARASPQTGNQAHAAEDDNVDPLHHGVTRPGQAVGTPAYMAPEQRDGGRVDARADQYAFCVALHEALFGRRPPPLAERDRGAGNQRVPRRVLRALSRGLELDPADRWPSMDTLLHALGAPNSHRAWGRWRWFAGAAAGTATVAAGAWALAPASVDPQCSVGAREIATVWGPQRAAAVREAFARTAVPWASDSAQRVTVGLDAYAASWAAARAAICDETVPGELDRATRRRLACLTARKRELHATIDVLAEANEAVITRAVASVVGLRPVDECHDDAPRIDPANAEVRDKLARVRALQGAGEYTEAKRLARAAVVATNALGEPTDPLLAARALHRLGSALHGAGDPKAAADNLERAAWLAAEHGHDHLAADAMVQLVYVVGGKLARPDEGRGWARHAEAAVSRAGSDPEQMAELWDNLGIVAYDEGDYDRAAQYHRRAQDHLTAHRGPQHPRLVAYLNNLGNVHYSQGRYPQALETYETVLRRRIERYGPLHPAVSDAKNNIANIYYAQGRLDEALAAYDEIVRRRSAAGQGGVALAHAVHNRSNIFIARGEYDRAIEGYTRAIEVWEQTVGPKHPSLAGSLNNLGSALSRMDRFDESERVLRRAIRVLEDAWGPEHPDLGDLLHNLAMALSNQDRLDEARSTHERALRLRETTLGPDHISVAASLSGLGRVLHRQGESERALSHLRRSLAIRERALGPDNPDLAYSLAALGDVHRDQGRTEAAIAAFERAVTILANSDVEIRRLGEARFDLAEVLWTAGQHARARSLARQSRDDFKAAGAPKTDHLEIVRAWLRRHDER